ncbi:HAD family hydrolase [Tomitella biformata]|uniref:HAD family hydrolase n=1 Tax=Tomitella biformata TaxID=630403 RepID=UPI00046705EC|nr:HAD family hydrolase [Tomitella biformata]
MRKPLLIASDVDGTLIDDEYQVGARNIAAITAAVADGVPFVLCTGRPPRWIAQVTDQLGHAPIAVCANGAVVFDSATDRVLSAHTLNPDDLGHLAELIRSAIPGAALAAERIDLGAEGGLAMQFATAPGYEHAWENPQNIEVSVADLVTMPAVKLLVRMPGARSADMRDALTPLIGDRADLTFSTDNGLIEIAAHGVTKATGLAGVARELGMLEDDVIAFGDMPNDIPMLGWAWHGVAMANAHAELAAVADEVTGSNNDSGVALVLERWWG